MAAQSAGSVDAQGSHPAEGQLCENTQLANQIASTRPNKWTAIICILLACGISTVWGISLANELNGSVDFQAVYFGTRCLLQGHNPYHVSELSDVYRAAGGEVAGKTAIAIRTVTQYVNLPTTFVLFAPFAMLPIGLAHELWFALGAGLYVVSSFLIWQIGSRYGSGVSLLLIGLVLANAQVAFQTGNTALLVAGLCIAGVCCLAEDRFALAGVLCLAVCLAIKPHDVGWIWLYFLLAGGICKRRALQSFFVTAGFGLAALVWIWHVAPQWLFYWRINLADIAKQGGLNEPGPGALTGRSPGMVISLQSAISVLTDKPVLYNAVSYLVCGLILLIWALHTLKLRNWRPHIWLGLAAVVAPTLLITYHRSYDAKLLLLTVPACAMLWSKRGLTGWSALLLTTAAIVFTGDIPLTGWIILTDHMRISTSGVLQKMIAVVFLEPTPLILLVMGIFYLWAYVKSGAGLTAIEESKDTNPVPQVTHTAPSGGVRLGQAFGIPQLWAAAKNVVGGQE